MKIIQLTDLHLGEADECPQGVDVRSNFLGMLDYALREKPDLFVLSGDLCYRDPSRATYAWIKKIMDNTGIPWQVTPGNHDDTDLLAEVFELSGEVRNHCLDRRMERGEWVILFVDSGKGHVSELQLLWLQRQLAEAGDLIAVFIHHPVLEADVPFMDINYPLQNKAEVEQVLCNSGKQVVVFSGHYHVEKTIIRGRISQFITPSTFLQINPVSENFEVDHYRPAFREIVLSGEGTLNTRLVYDHSDRAIAVSR